LTLKVGVGVAVEALAGESKTGTDGGWLPDGGGCPPFPPPPQPLTTNITVNTINQIAHLTIAFHLGFIFPSSEAKFISTLLPLLTELPSLPHQLP
jgi:hypothetical protein